MLAAMQALALLDGAKIPAFGLGTWLAEPEVVREAVRVAIEVGYRHVDTAWIYLNEEAVGLGIADAVSSGVVAREDLWITTKLWNDCHAPEHVRPALERSLGLLGLEYVDLYLIHWPVALRHGKVRPQGPEDYLSLAQRPLETTWAAMAELPQTGLTRHVGVSNFSASKIATIVDAVGAMPAVNQVEMHPYNQQNELLAAMKQRGIVTTAYAPLGSRGRPSGLRQDDEKSLLDDPIVASIAEGHGATAAQVLIAWALGRGTAVIPKSTNADRIAANFEATKLALSPDDMAKLAPLDRGARYIDGTFWCTPGSPYTVEELWG